MQAKGLFTFFLAVALIPVYLFLSSESSSALNTLDRAWLFALSSEEASFERFVLEENADYILEKTVQKEILLGERDPKKIKKSIAKNLLELFKKFEVEGKSWLSTVKLLSQGRYAVQNEKPEAEELEELMQVNVKSVKNIYLVEVSFPGEKQRNKTLGVEIKKGSISTLFVFPVGYVNGVIAFGG